jgi:hypothetical protein
MKENKLFVHNYAAHKENVTNNYALLILTNHFFKVDKLFVQTLCK